MTSEVFALFKSYDVRGTYPQINGHIAYWTGYALIKEVLEKENLQLTVNVMHDHRLSSPELYSAIIQGIIDAGGTVNMLGLGSTDMMYAACIMYNNAGVMITASHNPKDDNGIKIIKKAPYALGIGSGLELIRDSKYFSEFKLIDKEFLNKYSEKDNNNLAIQELDNFYFKKLLDLGKVEALTEKLKNRKLKVVVDTGNGIGGLLMKKFISPLYPNIEFIPLFWDLDGNYPNHPADPLNNANILDLQKAVRQHKADFGIAFDGDADRAFFVDENGDRVIGDYLVAKFGEHFLNDYFKNKQNYPDQNPIIVYNQPASRCTKNVAEINGGSGVAAKQGHVYMKSKLFETKGLYAGEHSGHHYFPQFGCMDSGSLAVTLFISIILENNINASDLTKDLKEKYFLSGEMNFKLQGTLDANKRLQIIKTKLIQKYTDAKIEDLDGISVVYPEWKFNIRLSNTEPLLRLNIETVDRDFVSEKVFEVKNLLELSNS